MDVARTEPASGKPSLNTRLQVQQELLWPPFSLNSEHRATVTQLAGPPNRQPKLLWPLFSLNAKRTANSQQPTRIQENISPPSIAKFRTRSRRRATLEPSQRATQAFMAPLFAKWVADSPQPTRHTKTFLPPFSLNTQRPAHSPQEHTETLFPPPALIRNSAFRVPNSRLGKGRYNRANG
jgi:hypothetical protein